jgi:hypothetical protein
VNLTPGQDGYFVPPLAAGAPVADVSPKRGKPRPYPLDDVASDDGMPAGKDPRE